MPRVIFFFFFFSASWREAKWRGSLKTTVHFRDFFFFFGPNILTPRAGERSVMSSERISSQHKTCFTKRPKILFSAKRRAPLCLFFCGRGRVLWQQAKPQLHEQGERRRQTHPSQRRGEPAWIGSCLLCCSEDSGGLFEITMQSRPRCQVSNDTHICYELTPRALFLLLTSKPSYQQTPSHLFFFKSHYVYYATPVLKDPRQPCFNLVHMVFLMSYMTHHEWNKQSKPRLSGPITASQTFRQPQETIPSSRRAGLSEGRSQVRLRIGYWLQSCKRTNERSCSWEANCRLQGSVLPQKLHK